MTLLERRPGHPADDETPPMGTAAPTPAPWSPPGSPPGSPPRPLPTATQVSPRRLSALGTDDLAEFAIAAFVAFHAVWFLRVLLDWDGILGAALLWYLAFVAVHFLIVSFRLTSAVATDRLVTTCVWSVGVVVSGVLAWMVGYVVVKGAKLISWSFLTQDLSTVGALDAGGGAAHALVGTIEQVGLATVIVVPIAVLTAVYLHEYDGKLAAPIRFVVDALSGLPSIVAGLLMFTIWPSFEPSGVKASAALLVLMLPPITRATEEILRTVPDPLREASLALGAPRWRVIMQVVLPTARSGLLTAVLLGIARAIGETAPVILTALGSSVMNTNPLSGAQASLPTFVWALIRVPDKTQNDRAWGGALLLVMFVLVLFATARVVSARGDRRLGRRR